MFFKKIMDKQVKKPLKYKVKYKDLCDGVIISKHL